MDFTLAGFLVAGKLMYPRVWVVASPGMMSPHVSLTLQTGQSHSLSPVCTQTARDSNEYILNLPKPLMRPVGGCYLGLPYTALIMYNGTYKASQSTLDFMNCTVAKLSTSLWWPDMPHTLGDFRDQ